MKDELFQSALQFYSIYLSKLTQLRDSSPTISLLVENISYLFDVPCTNSDVVETTGSELCKKLIKEFDKCFLDETNQKLKLTISNIMKCLLSLSDSAKKTALNGKIQ